ncbi:redoxin domain protein [Clostridium sp. CAG:1219]|nr:redoxin domain protein [Clostridium sp. CAG:1219]
MFLSKKSRRNKELDGVFKMIEEKENIIETEEEKNERIIKAKEMSKIRLILILIVVGSILIASLYLVYTIYMKTSGKYLNLKSKNRNEYIINNVDETLLTNYIEKGKYTMVSFWASWCSNCQKESEALNSFMINNKDINFIVVSHDNSVDELNSYLQSHENYNWFIIYDNKKTIRASIDKDANTIPRTYLLDGNGNVVDFIKGIATEEKLKELYKKAK